MTRCSSDWTMSKSHSGGSLILVSLLNTTVSIYRFWKYEVTQSNPKMCQEHICICTEDYVPESLVWILLPFIALILIELQVCFSVSGRMWSWRITCNHLVRTPHTEVHALLLFSSFIRRTAGPGHFLGRTLQVRNVTFGLLFFALPILSLLSRSSLSLSLTASPMNPKPVIYVLAHFTVPPHLRHTTFQQTDILTCTHTHTQTCYCLSHIMTTLHFSSALLQTSGQQQ